MTARAQALKRLQSPRVNYMELRAYGGGFSCGNCRFASGGYCTNQNVQAPISLLHGCCNEFQPATENPLPPSQWEAFR